MQEFGLEVGGIIFVPLRQIEENGGRKSENPNSLLLRIDRFGPKAGSNTGAHPDRQTTVKGVKFPVLDGSNFDPG